MRNDNCLEFQIRFYRETATHYRAQIEENKSSRNFTVYNMKPVLKIAKNVSFGMDMSEVRIDSKYERYKHTFYNYIAFHFRKSNM